MKTTRMFVVVLLGLSVFWTGGVFAQTDADLAIVGGMLIDGNGGPQFRIP